jgi:hypothetical protein
MVDLVVGGAKLALELDGLILSLVALLYKLVQLTV